MVKTPKRNTSLKINTPTRSSSNNSQEILNFDNPKPTIKSLTCGMSSMNYLAKENDVLRTRIDNVDTENNILLKKNELAERSMKNKANEISDLKFELNEIRQEKLESHFNINGLPQLTKDEAIDVVLKIANELDINLTHSDVKDVQYFNDKKNQQARLHV